MPKLKQKKPLQKSSTENGAGKEKRNTQISCPIVGMGASAGGLAAFKTFFSHMPDDSGMAFVLVPHLDPEHKSLMVELLSHHTEMPVCEAKDDMAVEPDHIYIIPPAWNLAIEHGRLYLSKPPQPRRIETAIDYFLRSLAEDQMERAIGIILSGTSSHGTLGLQAIKANGGMAMVQRPDTAEYDAMPQNAIDTGVVDYILPPEEMPAALIKYVLHAYVSGNWQPTEPAQTELEQLDLILGLLRARTKYDFRYYRKNMIMRRVQRRMSLNHIDQLTSYYEFLRENSAEATRLFRDMLISVTAFFRDKDAYDVLEQRVIPQWIMDKDEDSPIRIWVSGCATGEEAYSIAMLLIETYTAAHKPLNLQIFATDIDDAALDIARKGLYPVSIAADISSERLARFFSKTGSHYQVNKQMRDMVVFASQNLISDAPFSRIDLICCRNLLIYLEPEVQRKVISLFHFALKEDGHLFLGSSETLGRHIDLFETVSKKWRIFRKVGPSRRDIVNFPITSGYIHRGNTSQPAAKLPATREINYAALTQRQLLDDYAPASVLINRKYEVLYYQGPTGDFLEPPTGEPTRDLIAMARQGLQTKLRAACHKAIHENQPVTDASARVKRNGSWQPCIILVKPIIEPKQAEGLLLVTFQERDAIEAATTDAQSAAIPVEESSLVQQLEYELKAMRDDLQTTIEDKESSNEELKASNEEIMSMNEELQSANEELETSKEELQSLNEELSTVNSQLQDKIEELDKAYNDMTNLLNSADIATLFLDTEFCIRQFTPATGRLLNLLDSDRGRPIRTFATDFTGEDLLTDARQVLNMLTPLENVLTTSDGHHYMRRTLPYRTADNRIEGLVVTFIDITRRILSEQQSKRMASVLYDSIDAIILLSLDGSITAWNHGAENMYGYSEAEALKMNLSNMVPPDKQAEMRDYLQRIGHGEEIKSFDTTRLTKHGHTLDVWVTVTTLKNESGQPTAIAITERDITERLQLNALRVQTDQLLSMVEHLPTGAVYLDHDQLKINRATEKITGYGRHELTSVSQWFEKLHGENEAEMKQFYQREREAGFPNRPDPIAIRCKNGEQRFIEFAGYRFDDHEVWIVHDITQRERAEAAVREREERLRAIMDNAAEAIVVINSSGTITDFNNAAQLLFGYAADEAIGGNVKQLMPSPYREAHDDYLARYMKSHMPKLIRQAKELPGCRKDGSVFPLRITVTEINHLGIFIGIMYDLTEQKALEKEIANISTKERERLGQELHDGIGQQLTGLNMMAVSIKRSLANRNFPEAEQVDEMIAQLQKATKEARALSRGLMPVPVTPEGLRQALTLLARDVKKTTNIDCHFEAHDTGNIEHQIEDRTVAMHIYQITQEAVNNAVKHAQPSKISILLKTTPESSELTISDNGCGFQVDAANSEGMGIRIMRYRAGVIGYHLVIESTPGKGTIVRCKHVAA